MRQENATKRTNIMKTTKIFQRPNRLLLAFLRRKVNSAVGSLILACFLTAANTSRAGEPAFITTPSTLSGTTSATQPQGPVRFSSDLNQAAVGQIMNELNQGQSQLNAASAQTSAQFPVFLRETTAVRRAK